MGAGLVFVKKWNAEFVRDESSFSVTPNAWNTRLEPGETTHFGFQGINRGELGEPQNISCGGPVEPENNIPTVDITAPADQETYSPGQEITFTATATDVEDGDLSDAITWSSDLAGDLGTGASITTLLPLGTNIITASATDQAGFTGSSTLTINVVKPPPTEPEVVGSSPDEFGGLGGTFSVVTVIEDTEGNPITDELELDNFSFTDISLDPVRTPDTALTDGTAEATKLEVGSANGGPVSIAIMIDNSGSMGSNDRQQLRFDAAEQLIDLLALPDEVAVGSLNSVRQPLTTDYEAASVIARQNSGGSSDVYNGVVRAADELVEAGNPTKAIVALTDGQTSLRNFETAVARANAINAPVYTVGLGTNLQFDKLQEIAARTGGTFGEANKAEDLQRVFNAIGRSITEGGVRVTGAATFDTPLSQAGQYILSGTLVTNVRGETFSTPFTFRVFIDNSDLSALPPSLTEVTPDKGATVGGSEIVLTGDNFSRVNTVRFGAIPASSFSIESNTRLRAIVPVQAAGTVSVTVASPEGQSNAVDFTYTTLPAIASIAPNKVSTLGGASVVITGSSFADVTGVNFSAQAATSFTVDSETQITAIVPAATDEGDVTVTVSTVVGPSNAADLTYAAPPSVNALNPGSALIAGGAGITLSGTNFTETTSVSFGNKAATSFIVNSDTSITAVVPAAPEGNVELKVTSPYGSSAASAMNVNVGENVLFNWIVNDSDSQSLTCEFLPHSDEEIIRVPDCEIRTSLTYVYTDAGTYTAQVRVSDGFSSVSKTVQIVVVSNSEIVSFDEPDVQTAWQSVLSNENVSLLKLRFNSAQAVIQRNGDLFSFAIPEIGQDSYLIASVKRDSLVEATLFSFDQENDNLTVFNVLRPRSVNFSPIDMIEAPSSKEKFEFLVSDPEFSGVPLPSNQIGQFSLRTASIGTCGEGGSCITALTNYSLARDVYADALGDTGKFLKTARDAVLDCGLNFAPGNLIADLRLLPFTCNGPSIGGFATALAENTAKATWAFQSYADLFDCARRNLPNYRAGAAFIAVASPPLPFSGLVLVQSVPDKLNLYSGTPSETYAIGNLLNDAIPNAVITWEVATGTTIQTAFANPFKNTIFATYATQTPAPLCLE